MWNYDGLPNAFRGPKIIGDEHADVLMFDLFAYHRVQKVWYSTHPKPGIAAFSSNSTSVGTQVWNFVYPAKPQSMPLNVAYTDGRVTLIQSVTTTKTTLGPNADFYLPADWE
jgi:hypothetical protein